MVTGVASQTYVNFVARMSMHSQCRDQTVADVYSLNHSETATGSVGVFGRRRINSKKKEEALGCAAGAPHYDRSCRMISVRPLAPFAPRLPLTQLIRSNDRVVAVFATVCCRPVRDAAIHAS